MIGGKTSETKCKPPDCLTFEAMYSNLEKYKYKEEFQVQTCKDESRTDPLAFGQGVPKECDGGQHGEELSVKRNKMCLPASTPQSCVIIKRLY
jgi:hypothetical protein